MKSKIILAVLSLALLSGTARATTYVVWGTMLSTYAQSTAHLMQSSKGIYNNGPHP